MNTHQRGNGKEIQNEFKRLSEIDSDSINFYLEWYLDSKKIQQFQYNFLRELGVYIEENESEMDNFLHLSDYMLNEFTPINFEYAQSFSKETYNEVLSYFKKFVKLCIQHADIKLEILWQSNPIELLKDIKKIWKSEYDIKLLYDSEMYTYTLQNCPNIKEVLNLFPHMDSIELSEGLQKWHNKNKCKNASIKIQHAFLQWLYRPGGIIMKNAESHFYKLAATVHG